MTIHYFPEKECPICNKPENKKNIMINTVAELKKALEVFPDTMEVRNVFDAAGNYYFPHVALMEEKFINGDRVLLLMQEVENLESIKGVIEISRLLTPTKWGDTI
jgi:hypothetical protein